MIASKTLALLVVATLVAATPANAQCAQCSVMATARFDEGRKLMARKRYREACAAFEQSQHLDPQLGTQFNLAACYEQIGKLASAWAVFRELGQRDSNLRRRAAARKRAASLDNRLARLSIVVPAAPPGLVIELDGVDVTALAGASTPIDLGQHEIRARAPGYRELRRTMFAKEASVDSVTIVLESTPVPPPASVSPPVAEEPASDDHTNDESQDALFAPGRRRSERVTAGWITAGAGGALVVTGLVFGKLAQSRWDDAKKACGDDLQCEDVAAKFKGDRLVEEARTRAHLSTGLLIGGVAAIGIGVALVLTAPRTHGRDATALRVMPEASSTGVSIAVAGRF